MSQDNQTDPSNFDFLGMASRDARPGAPTEEDVALAPMVLIVEDDPDISRSLQIRLNMHGFRTCQAFDAVLAMDVAKKNAPEVVILDISIPGGNGFDVAKRLQEDPTTANVPVIFLTASMRPDLPEKASAVNAAAFMTKPYDSAALIDQVRKLVSSAYELG